MRAGSLRAGYALAACCGRRRDHDHRRPGTLPCAAASGSDTLGGVGFIGFGIVVVGVGIVVLYLSNVLFGAVVLGFGIAGIGFGIHMLTSTGTGGRTRASSDASVQDHDSQDATDG
jgi:hypothetical protein